MVEASAAERALEALAGVLAAAAPVGAEFARNEVFPTWVPAAGMMILRDGDPGEPEVTLSPLRHHYAHLADLDLVVEAADPETRAARLDALRMAVGLALEAAPTLGGAVDWCEPEPAEPADIAVEGAETLAGVVVTIRIHYAAGEDPLALI